MQESTPLIRWAVWLMNYITESHHYVYTHTSDTIGDKPGTAEDGNEVTDGGKGSSPGG